MRCTWSYGPISSTECLGIHLGDPQCANLGDGNGCVNQTVELREDYGDASVGTCLESAIGGNHFRCVEDDHYWLQKTHLFCRVFRQNGPSANSGALFLAYVYTQPNRVTIA